jgi:hypothetical protein
VAKIEDEMAKRQSKTHPTWTNVKQKLAGFDRAELLGLLHDLYAASKDNRTFLHARFCVSEDVLQPYKETIDRWLWPDVFRHQDVSVSKARQAISDYKKAVGEPAGLAELSVFFCERMVGFSEEVGYDDAYSNALLGTFAQALQVASDLPDGEWKGMVARLDRLSDISEQFGYGVGEAMVYLLMEYAAEEVGEGD